MNSQAASSPPDTDFEDLLAQTSLGTAGAQQLRSRVTDAELAAVHARLAGTAAPATSSRAQSQTPPHRPADSPLQEVVFLTVAEVAAVMRVSKMTVYRLVHAGAFPAIRVGRSFRVPEKAVWEYLRETAVETA